MLLVNAKNWQSAALTPQIQIQLKERKSYSKCVKEKKAHCIPLTALALALRSAREQAHAVRRRKLLEACKRKKAHRIPLALGAAY